MDLVKGQKIWLPCEVKPGPFADERLVRVNSTAGSWLGFVPDWALQQPISEGMTKILAVIIEIHNSTITVQFQGQSVTPGPFVDNASRAERFVAI